VLASRRAVTPQGVRPAWIRVRGGAIAEVSADAFAAGVAPVVDVEQRVLMPGVIDTHVHVNEPGRTEWEGFGTATRAAAAGGVTTLIDMPLNSIPPTTTLAGFHAKVECAAARCRVHVGFWGGLVPGNGADLAPLRKAGVFGFKCFLVPSGVEEFAHVAPEDLKRVAGILRDPPSRLLVHAEEPGEIVATWSGPSDSYASYLATRPPGAETKAVARMVELCRTSGVRIHILHLASADAGEIVREAKREGLPVSAETCPHYLTFAAEEIPDGATEFKCAPPIRDRRNRERLWELLGQGAIDSIASDHSPAPPALKLRETGDFRRAWGGIASLEVSLPAVWTQALARGFSIADVSRWMSAGPARLAGLAHRKGAIMPGFDADLVVFEPDAPWVVDPGKLHHRHALTPYAGRTLKGRVQATYVRGEKVYDGSDVSGPACGEILLA
jgi:allantoinase